MTHRELLEWMRYEATVSPLPDRLTDMHFALLASIVINRTRSSDSEPVQMSDFYMIHDAPIADDEDDDRTEAERAAQTWRGG